MGEFSLGLDIPDEVFDHPLIKTIEDCGTAITAMANVSPCPSGGSDESHRVQLTLRSCNQDVYSYNKEQAQGDSRNIIAIAMKEKRCSLQEAFDYVRRLIVDQVDLLNASKLQLPSWGPEVDAQAAKYIRICEDCTFGSCRWSLRCPRYFGRYSEEVSRTLVVQLLAPGEKPPQGPSPPRRRRTAVPNEVAAPETRIVSTAWSTSTYTAARRLLEWLSTLVH